MKNRPQPGRAKVQPVEWLQLLQLLAHSRGYVGAGLAEVGAKKA